MNPGSLSQGKRDLSAAMLLAVPLVIPTIIKSKCI